MQIFLALFDIKSHFVTDIYEHNVSIASIGCCTIFGKYIKTYWVSGTISNISAKQCVDIFEYVLLFVDFRYSFLKC